MSAALRIPADRNPVLNPAWSGPSPKVAGYGHFWAEEGANGSTVLFFDAGRTIHACTVFQAASEGEVVDLVGRDWIVTWAAGVAALADRVAA